MTPLVHLAII